MAKGNKMTSEQILKAAKLIKIIRLVNNGLDAVAVKINCEPTRTEEEAAKYWAKAFELAQTNKSIWEAAEELDNYGGRNGI